MRTRFIHTSRTRYYATRNMKVAGLPAGAQEKSSQQDYHHDRSY